jgi:adenosylmethionine-8-amino-7-oxononanoate aminotransferase
LKTELIERGVWLRPFGDMIYTTPPLCISPTDLAQLSNAMIEATRAWALG